MINCRQTVLVSLVIYLRYTECQGIPIDTLGLLVYEQRQSPI